MGVAFSDGNNPLFEHPAILAAVTAIEAVTAIASEEKVLVFGRFTAPLQALVALLNARAMLRALAGGEPWAQSTVHNDDWPAIQAAHRQLGLPGVANRDELDGQLERQYRALESIRRHRREHLLEQLDASLSQGRSRRLFEALCLAVENHDQQGESPLVLVAKAVHELTSGDESPAGLATAFEALIDALCERGEEDEGDDQVLSTEQAMDLWDRLQSRINDEYGRQIGGFARLMYGGTPHRTRRLLQLAFNRPRSHPQVLVAQSVVGREGLNLHKSCKTVVLLHPEWNPGVVEQQIGRVDRVGSLWERQLEEALACNDQDLPRILVRPVVFRGTYDEGNWAVLRERWDDLRAQLHGVVVSPSAAISAGLDDELIDAINALAPGFSPIETKPD